MVDGDIFGVQTVFIFAISLTNIDMEGQDKLTTDDAALILEQKLSELNLPGLVAQSFLDNVREVSNDPTAGQKLNQERLAEIEGSLDLIVKQVVERAAAVLGHETGSTVRGVAYQADQRVLAASLKAAGLDPDAASDVAQTC